MAMDPRKNPCPVVFSPQTRRLGCAPVLPIDGSHRPCPDDKAQLSSQADRACAGDAARRRLLPKPCDVVLMNHHPKLACETSAF